MTTETPHAEAQKALDKAKIQLMSSPDTAFFTTVCFSLKHQWNDKIPTACTNGRWVHYNPEFFMKCSPAEQVGLMLHETLHVVFMHMTRLNERDPMKWNIATDYVINLIIKDRGFELPKGALLDDAYRDMHADEVYDLLPEPDPKDPPEIHFEMPKEDDGSPVDPNQVKDDIGDVLVRAQIQSKLAGDKAGTIPGEIEVFLNRLLKPKLPTGKLLRRYFNGFARTDYTWMKPNRRFFPEHHLPSQHGEALGHVAIAVDASGSVSDGEFTRFISEIAGVFRKHKPELITLITFDTSIRQVDEIKSAKDLHKISFKGRGGTAIRPVVDWAVEHQPKVMLVFSDGGFYFHEDTVIPQKVPFLWLIHQNPGWQAPYGRVIHYDIED